MDLSKALRELFEEKKRIDRAIARLESRMAIMMRRSGLPRRGRKSMGPEERLEVSRRMRAYWQSRRSGAQDKEN